MIPNLVLASSSPRRRELLALLGLPYTVVPSLYEEPSPPLEHVSLSNLVTTLSIEKAREVAARLSDDTVFVIGADTLVTLSEGDIGVPMGKPADYTDAMAMLSQLSNRTHYVYTGIAIAAYRNGCAIVLESRVERTGVTFRQLTHDMIDAYIRTGEPMDKAGAYGAQGYAAPFIRAFEGDFYNVVGLPLCALGELLENVGVDWQANRVVMPPVIG